MSLAFDKPTDQIQRPRFDQANMWIYNNNNGNSSRFTREHEDDDDDDDRDSGSSSSSIGNNSDASGGGGGGDSDDGGEVQSLFKGSLNNLCDLENALPIKRGISTFYGNNSDASGGNNSDASGGGGGGDSDDGGEVQSLFKGSLNNLCDLENALPIKRGISTFYAGKSKSYTSLADAVSAPSIQDIVKPEDAYNRKRKNMLAHTVLLDKSRNFASKSGISKRLNNNNGGNVVGESSSLSSSPSGSLPPLPARPKKPPTKESLGSSPRTFCSPWRSLSLSDLQHAAGASSSVIGSRGNSRGEDND